MHQGHEIETLSAELYLQQKQIAKLQTQMALLLSKLKTQEDHESAPDLGREPPPPHY